MKTEVLLKLVLNTSDEREESEVQDAVLQALPERIAGVLISSAEIVAGGVDNDGVPCQPRVKDMIEKGSK